MNGRAFLVSLSAVGLGLLPGPHRALAQAIQVTPIQLELTARARNGIVTLQNLGPEPMRLQISAFGWQQGPRGEMQLTRTKDLTFFPGLLTIDAGQKRNLRVAAAAPFTEAEKTYRVFVEQLPGAPGAPGTSVRVLARIGIPVYLEPARPSRAAELSPIHVDGRRISFILRNTGNVRVRPESLKVVGKDRDGAVVFEQALSVWYVLAGGERVFETDAPPGGCEAVRSLAAEVQLETGTLRTERPADGACAP